MLAKCGLLVCHDSGPMHLAASQGTHCVALFGNYNLPRQWFPYGEGHCVIHAPLGVQQIGVERGVGFDRGGGARSAGNAAGSVGGMMNSVSVTSSGSDSRWTASTLVFFSRRRSRARGDLVYLQLRVYRRRRPISTSTTRAALRQVRALPSTAFTPTETPAPAWVLLLNIPHALGLDWISSAKLLGALGLVSTLLAVVCLLEELPTRATGRDPLFVLAAVAVTILNPYFVQWSFSGMETVTAVGVGLWIIRGAFVGAAGWPRPSECGGAGGCCAAAAPGTSAVGCRGGTGRDVARLASGAKSFVRRRCYCWPRRRRVDGPAAPRLVCLRPAGVWCRGAEH